MTMAVGVNQAPNNMAAYDMIADEWEIVNPKTVVIPENQYNAMQHQIAARISVGEFAERQSKINEDLIKRVESLEKDNEMLENKKIKAEAESGILKSLAIFASGCVFYGNAGGVGAGIFVYNVIQSANVIINAKNIYYHAIEWKNAKA